MDTEGPASDPDRIEALLAALGGKYAARILAATDVPKSAQTLSDELDVPIATCYRRIEELEETDLLVCEGRETSDRGRRTKVYRRTVEGAELDLETDGPRLALDVRSDEQDSLRDRSNS